MCLRFLIFNICSFCICNLLQKGLCIFYWAKCLLIMNSTRNFNYRTYFVYFYTFISFAFYRKQTFCYLLSSYFMKSQLLLLSILVLLKSHHPLDHCHFSFEIAHSFCDVSWNKLYGSLTHDRFL